MVAAHKEEGVVCVATAGELGEIVVRYASLTLGRGILVHKFYPLGDYVRAFVIVFHNGLLWLGLRDVLYLGPLVEACTDHTYASLKVGFEAFLTKHVVLRKVPFWNLLVFD